MIKPLRIFALVLLTAVPARAELTPDQVAILAMAESEPSRQLADYYAKARGIPATQILLLPGKPTETLSPTAWETQTRPAIRKWLGEKGARSKIRCLVTCWDVPLKIDRRSSQAPDAVARQSFLAQSRASLIEQLGGQLKTLDSIAPAEKPAERPALTAERPAKEVTTQVDAALTTAQQRLQALPSEEEKKKAGKVFEQAFLATGGLSGIVQLVSRPGAARLEGEAAHRLEMFKGQLQGLAEGLQALSTLPDTAARDQQILSLIQKHSGLIGMLQWVDQEQQLLKSNESYSSFDSELALVYWPDYPVLRWLPNMLHYRFDGLPPGRAPTLMVARLEAPTVELVKKLIDAALATEKAGLSGKVYLDARGISFDPKKGGHGSYGEYDQSLRDLADRLKKHTKLEVVLDDKAELFKPGSCPDAAIYCGWYSLGQYVDAFTWRPGSVGYHIASSEAATLRTPGGKVWCNAMLERGVCATLGPVYEPYLAAFPLPDDFFSLLLSGRYTLVESYFRTLPYNSWVMVLVGDPLYNPFKAKPALSEDALPERLRAKGEGK